MTTFYSEDELCGLGLKRYGANVLISRNAIIYKPDKLEIGSNVRIDDFVTISGNVVLGNYIHIAQNSSLFGGTAGILMDDFSGISSHVAIYAVSNDYSGRFMTNPTVPDKYTCDLGCRAFRAARNCRMWFSSITRSHYTSRVFHWGNVPMQQGPS